ncbi:hypothetical protein [Xylella fastidiosa]|uniref:Uncharacterized protein n=1 Tax=Xylella fastidiosa subsp. sandyi Ann-1 TaxID=155920 RepID=A0A060HAQ1_XYLFS|nr:hypothetical protein [Xylella fastidiosa]AIC10416.1 hypothetical protein D934_10285 [Xylella fastidiosa subsp. sandyi Ann-1]UIX80619.1 hypothetical protein LZ756_08940 [Xylella fastidiosa subsp. sandyi]
MTGLTVTTKHLFTIPHFSRRAGFCRDGARQFFMDHGLDWSDFVRNGIAAEALSATKDALANALVAWAQQCEQGHIDGR